MCIVRLLAEDESRADRAHRRVDLALLDAVTWPEFVWDWLRLVGVCDSIAFALTNMSRHCRRLLCFSCDAAPDTGWMKQTLRCLCAGDPLLACRWSDPNVSAAGPRSRRPPMWPPRGSDPDQEGHPPASPRGGVRLGREFHALPLEQKVAILDRLTGHLLDVHSVREVRHL